MYHTTSFQFARQFYIAMWYRDSAAEIERAQNKNAKTPEKEKKVEKKKDRPKRSSRRIASDSESEDEEVFSEEEDEEESKKKQAVAMELERLKEIQEMAEKRKVFLIKQISTKIGAFATFK